MLNPDAAKKELEKFKSKRFVEERIARIAGLPDAIRPDARDIFGVAQELEAQPLSVSQVQQRQALEEKRLAAFEKLGLENLQNLLRAVIPDLAPYVTRAINLMDRLPYTGGWNRKPFRAPTLGAVVNGVRLNFLRSLVSEIKDYPPDVEWIAAWAPHAWPYNDWFVGPLLAAAIEENDAKGQRVYGILVASAKGEHEVGQMGRHVLSALLIANKPEGWELVEKMLLAAQREEGLRQAILEKIDECHPEVFRWFLRVALEHDLVRFSACVRAVDVWFGFLWDAMSVGKARQIIEQALKFLDDPAAADVAIATAHSLAPAKAKGKKLIEAEPQVEPAYIALWTKAFLDAGKAMQLGVQLLQAPNADVRFAAVHLLGQLQLVGTVSKATAAALADPDERVAARALLHFSRYNFYDRRKPDRFVPDLFERLEKLFERSPEKTIKLAPIVWPWMQLPWGKETAGAAMIHALGDRPASRLIPYLKAFNSQTRRYAAERLGESQPHDAAIRQTLLTLVGDASETVRGTALQYLEKSAPVTEPEAAGLEALLSRKASDLRRAALSLLMKQSDEAALLSADRLTQMKDALQRQAGLELLRQMASAGRSTVECRRRAEAYRLSHPQIPAGETAQLDALIEPPPESITLDNCLGLIDPKTRTAPLEPQRRNVAYFSPASLELLRGLDELVHAHREESFTPRAHDGQPKEPMLLGNATWQFAFLDPREPFEPQLEALPFRELWFSWFDTRPKSMRDDDGLELIRARWLAETGRGHYSSDQLLPDWLAPLRDVMRGSPPQLRYGHVVTKVMRFLGRVHRATGAAEFLLDGLETALAMIPRDKLAQTVKRPYGSGEEIVWRDHNSPVVDWIDWMSDIVDFDTADRRTRRWRLLRWIDEPGVAIPRHRPQIQVLLEAMSVGGANEADVYDHFLGPREEAGYIRYSDLGQHCGLKPTDLLKHFPQIQPIVDRCRKRVLEVELSRGEAPTYVSTIARNLRYTGGLETLVPYLRAAETNTFTRGYAYRSDSKADVFSHIVRATYPGDGQTPQKFQPEVREKEIPENRLLELAVYAPQWAEHVEHTLGWPHLAEAVWWIHAHTRDRRWTVDQDIRERWQAQIAQRTPLAPEDLLDGAVDVAWFKRVYEGIGKKRWQEVYEVAKFAASGGGHKRAQLFADAMLGKVKTKDLTQRIISKRNQDAVRALGLVPLTGGDKLKGQILARYRTIQEFIRTSRQFGSQRQASEKRAAGIGMENLARTAGYPDPIRLQWAMEAHACADLARGPVRAAAADVEVSLSINTDGEPEVSASKKGKTLAQVPPAAKKNAKVAELLERKTELKRSRSRMRTSLEQAMVRGDSFSATELRELIANPLLAPMLVRLVFVGEGILGYPVDGGKGLVDHAGRIEPVKKKETLRLAHPHDLLATKHWSDWQHDCFARERVQPFKQIFRELYVATKTELEARDQSRRYAGHQVQPRQAVALLTSRGWVAAPEQGVFRTFHDAGWTAWLTFQESFFTPADIEGLTLESVRFTAKGEMRDWAQLEKVPPRIFSEVMRDVDLIVSVAHRGQVDPEASASTIQMRTALLGETLELLGLKNVRLNYNHALIKGELGEYTLHLGSAVTHKQPGGALFIVPVHSQHRGRLFLPFADDDPKTAEVISKVLLLARDSEIKDPNLLAQIRAVG